MTIKNKDKILKDLENFSEITDVSFDHEGSHLAVCHRSQGHGANGWKDIALIMKSEDIEVNSDILKALTQVSVELSMEEFLVRFFGLYWSDAEKLTYLLGMETEMQDYFKKEIEENQMEGDATDVMEYQAGQAKYKEYLDESVKHINIMKTLEASKDFSNIDPKDYLEILKTQIQFEQRVKVLDEIEKSKKAPAENKDTTQIKQPEVKSTPQESELDKQEDKSQMTDVTKTDDVQTAEQVDVTKSSEYIELLKRMEDLEKKAARVEELEKAQKSNLEKGFQSLTKSLTFVDEGQHEDLVKGLMDNIDNPVVDTLVQLLQKAQEQIEKTKEEFAVAAPGAEVGAEEAKEENKTDVKKSSLADRITEKYGQQSWL